MADEPNEPCGSSAEAPEGNVKPRSGIPLLLTQLGTHSATTFGERVAELGLTPPKVGILRMISTRPGLSQQALAEALDLLPSKLVTFVDELEQDGHVTRARKSRDRRVYELNTTERGDEVVERIGGIATELDSELTGSLTSAERDRLEELLRKVATHRGISPNVHPGYRGMS